MKISIRMKITFMFVCFAGFIIASSWYICNFLISDIFTNNLKNNLKNTYASCNLIFRQDAPRSEDGDLYGQIENPLEAIVIIYDPVNRRIFSTIDDESQMMESMNRVIETLNQSQSGAMQRPGEYIIKRNHDVLMNADYYDLMGRLDNGYIIIIRTPIAQIESWISLVTEVFNGIAIGLIIFGSLFILAFSNVFSMPIKVLNNNAKKMANLDFSVRVPVLTKDEIGELSASMNTLSGKLENTISELKSANIELARDIEKKSQIDEMRKEFISHVSHELKTPIALIQGYAEGLKDNMCDDDESREFYTDVIIDEAMKMNTMVKRLLTLSEIEFGGVKLNVQQFELVGFIRDVIAAKSLLLGECGATIEYKEEGNLFVWADEYMIEEVFTNYLINAIHYVKPNGTIKVFFEKYQGLVRVNVYNQGDQIPEEDLQKLFVKFYKADKARTREYGGNGIGLSIVAATMQAHGKSYGVYNVSDGVVFYFDLDANLP
ncbi:MAG: HAMP domain-containing protein [Lachnospiraceae bacterium]|nr:HAMP domain-containing protein [Lachnospiraceae bacterium]